jgi:hypothetical protein
MQGVEVIRWIFLLVFSIWHASIYIAVLVLLESRIYRSITGTCSAKDNGVESHIQSVSNFDDKASDNSDIPLGDNGTDNYSVIIILK